MVEMNPSTLRSIPGPHADITSRQFDGLPSPEHIACVPHVCGSAIWQVEGTPSATTSIT